MKTPTRPCCRVCHRRFSPRPGAPRSACPPCQVVLDRLPDTEDAWTRDLPAELRAERDARVRRHQARVHAAGCLPGVFGRPAGVAKGGAA